MEESEIPCMALLSAQVALLGVITPKIRAVSMEWKGFKNLYFRVHYESQPTEEEVEEMEKAVTEIISDVPFSWVDPVEVVIAKEPIPD